MPRNRKDEGVIGGKSRPGSTRRHFLGASAAGLVAATGVVGATQDGAQAAVGGGSFYPMIPSPVRAYDSRLGDGPLAVGQARAFNLVPFGIPNPVEAVLINLTVVNTSGRGYLAVAPGLPLVYTPGSYSNINWSGPGLVLANNATSTVGSIDPEAMEIVVYCEGAGSTDFIIDLQGYYV